MEYIADNKLFIFTEIGNGISNADSVYVSFMSVTYIGETLLCVSLYMMKTYKMLGKERMRQGRVGNRLLLKHHLLATLLMTMLVIRMSDAHYS